MHDIYFPFTFFLMFIVNVTFFFGKNAITKNKMVTWRYSGSI